MIGISLEEGKDKQKNENLSNDHISKGYNIVADFICPTETTERNLMLI